MNICRYFEETTAILAKIDNRFLSSQKRFVQVPRDHRFLVPGSRGRARGCPLCRARANRRDTVWGFGVYGLWFMVYGLWLRGWGLGFGSCMHTVEGLVVMQRFVQHGQFPGDAEAGVQRVSRSSSCGLQSFRSCRSFISSHLPGPVDPSFRPLSGRF